MQSKTASMIPSSPNWLHAAARESAGQVGTAGAARGRAGAGVWVALGGGGAWRGWEVGECRGRRARRLRGRRQGTWAGAGPVAAKATDHPRCCSMATGVVTGACNPRGCATQPRHTLHIALPMIWAPPEDLPVPRGSAERLGQAAHRVAAALGQRAAAGHPPGPQLRDRSIGRRRLRRFRRAGVQQQQERGECAGPHRHRDARQLPSAVSA